MAVIGTSLARKPASGRDSNSGEMFIERHDMKAGVTSTSNDGVRMAALDFVHPVRKVAGEHTQASIYGLTSEKEKRFLRQMMLLRQCELTTQEMFLLGKVPGFCHVYVGEEATAVGVCENLKKTDYIVSTHRGHGHCLAKGADPKLIFAELYGKKTGYCGGRGGSMHIFSKELGILGTNGIVGGGLPLSLGGAMHAKIRKTDQVSVCFFGDGASNQGTFHESINIAAIQRLPVLFVCENNLYATATRINEATLTKSVADRAAVYGVPGVSVDGNDVLAVYTAAHEAVERARKGNGPTLLECKTYRHYGHYVGENANYRPQQEVKGWLERDPIKLFLHHLIKDGVMTQGDVEQMELEVKAQVVEAERFASESPFPDASEVLQHVFAD
jgi:acetoin:2,6-dichlorophenolindophenol oxidoreductase subunit alpha